MRAHAPGPLSFPAFSSQQNTRRSLLHTALSHVMLASENAHSLSPFRAMENWQTRQMLSQCSQRLDTSLCARKECSVCSADVVAPKSQKTLPSAPDVEPPSSSPALLIPRPPLPASNLFHRLPGSRQHQAAPIPADQPALGRARPHDPSQNTSLGRARLRARRLPIATGYSVACSVGCDDPPPAVSGWAR